MKKITILALVLVLCLGVIGVGYSAWTDEIQIEGTVTTGSVDMEVTKYSGTWLYKNLDTDEAVTWSGWIEDKPACFDNEDLYLLVSSAVAGPRIVDGEIVDDEVVLTYWNILPDTVFCADFLLHYNGTIPAIVSASCCLADWPVSWKAEIWKSNEYGEQLQELGLPLQMHHCDYAIIKFLVDVEQVPETQNLEGSFTCTLTAIQWNEY